MSRSPIHASTRRVRSPGSSPRSARAGELEHVVELALEAHLLRERRHAALEPEQTHRDAPAVVDLADDERRLGAGVVEEHLVELTAARGLHDGSHLDAGLLHRHQQERQALVARRLRVGARDHEAPVRHVRQRRPHLLAVHHPLVAVAVRARRHVGEVGARVRFAVALAPTLVAAQDAGQEPLLLLGRPVRDQRGREQVLAHVVDPRGRLRRVRTPRPR